MAQLALALALAAGFLPAAAFSEPKGPQADAPHGLITAPYTSSVGAVLPPNRFVDEKLERNIDRRTPDEIRDDVIDRSICTGCD